MGKLESHVINALIVYIINSIEYHSKLVLIKVESLNYSIMHTVILTELIDKKLPIFYFFECWIHMV